MDEAIGVGGNRVTQFVQRRFELISLFLVWVLIFITGRFALTHGHGWDAEVYCGAAQMDAMRQNPYIQLIPSQLPHRLPWLYPPLLLNLFRLLCAEPFDYPRLYILYFAVILFASVIIWQPRRDTLLAFTLAFGGFGGFFWSLLTGNLELVLLLPVSLAIYALERERWSTAAFWLGITAVPKLVHLVYLLSLLWLPISWKERAKALGIGISTFFVLWLGLTWSRPDLAPSYLATLVKEMATTREPGSFYHPAFPFVWATLLGWPNDARGLLAGVIAGMVMAALFFWLIWRFLLPSLQPAQRNSFLAVTGFLLPTFFLPRFSPYTFVILLPPFFVLLRRRPAVGKGLALTPAVFPLLPSLLYQSPLKVFWITYNQPLAMFLALSTCLILEWRDARISKVEQSL
ncbi:MAG: glycosyltransferase 87 family protein [Anaerolineales bacterium]